jgi:hypothetical protein
MYFYESMLQEKSISIVSRDVCKLNDLKVIHDLYSQCLTQILSKTTSFNKPSAQQGGGRGPHGRLAQRRNKRAVRSKRPDLSAYTADLRGRVHGWWAGGGGLEFRVASS